MEKNKTYTIHISAEADPRLHAMFRSLGYDTDEFRTSGIVAGPVSCHPDMVLEMVDF
jgi:hypothetical protein